MQNLVGDVVSVIRDTGATGATVVGHDWGGAVAWQVAFNAPQVVENLVILNLPTPTALPRINTIPTNAQQRLCPQIHPRLRSWPDIFFGGQ